MIINHKYKFIFIKTKKTAGTSLEIALSKFCSKQDIITPLDSEDEKYREELGYTGAQNFLKPFTKYSLKDWLRLILKNKKAAGNYFYAHIPAKEIYAKINREIWENYFKFCIERNPYDKAISMYYWIKNVHLNDPHLSLHDFIKATNPKALSNYYIYSINNEIAVDYIGKYENLDEELEKISNHLKLPQKIELPVKKMKGNIRENNNHHRNLLSQYEKKLIEEVCCNEIDYFNYYF